MAIHSNAFVDEGVVIDPSNDIAAGVVIEKGVTIGQDNVIAANAFIGEGTSIGDGNEIQVGAVIGSPTAESRPSFASAMATTSGSTSPFIGLPGLEAKPLSVTIA